MGAGACNAGSLRQHPATIMKSRRCDILSIFTESVEISPVLCYTYTEVIPVPISYVKLWKVLVDKGMSKTDLKEQANISTNVLAKLGKNEPVSFESIEKICHALMCDIGDIMEIKTNPTEEPAPIQWDNGVEIYEPSYERLKAIDWSFANCHQDSISLLHPYPARFIEELPRQLIATLGCPDGTVILDPFCGSGTTLVEAQRAGFQSVGVDLNPIACLISHVKTSKLDECFLEAAKQIADRAEHRYRNDYVSIPEIPNLDHWFKVDIQKALSAIMAEISAAQIPESTKSAMLFSLSSIIVRVSNQESDTRYAAVEKRVMAPDVFKSFYSACKKLALAKQETSFDTPVTVIENNILTVTAENIGKKVGLVITSPPYPNAYEYWLYHKYRMWWLGYDPISVRSYEIGARPHYQKKNGQTEQDFEEQMSQVFTLFDHVVVVGGHICIVIGRSIIKGREIDNAEMMTRIAKRHGYTPVAKIPREIASTRKSFNLSYGKITTEHIMIYRRG